MRTILNKINISIIIISTLICTISIIYNILELNYSNIYVSIFILLNPLLIYILENLIKKRIDSYTKFSYYILIFMGVILGNIIDMYSKIILYDKFVHFCSGILISCLAINVYNYFNNTKSSNKLFLIIFIIAFNGCAASFWEVFEYLSDLVTKQGVQKGLIDTMGDMIAAITGGILYLLVTIKKM